jgi:hypothetical protein
MEEELEQPMPSCRETNQTMPNERQCEEEPEYGGVRGYRWSSSG